MFIPQVTRTLGATSNFVPIVHGLAISHSLKWVMNKVGSRNFFAWPIRNYNICPIDPIFFSFGDGGSCWIFLVHMVFSPISHNVPIKFSMDSQDILKFLNVFLTMFPKAPHFVSYVLLSLEVIYVGEYWDFQRE
jgi:hypothetical protein